MRKLLVCVLAMLMIMMCGCEEGYSTKELTPNKQISADILHFKDMVEECNRYAASLDPKLFLGDITIGFMDTSCETYEITFWYSKFISDNKVKTVVMDYDSKTRSITYVEISEGSSKALAPSEYSINTAECDTNFIADLKAVQESMDKKNIDSFEKIVCNYSGRYRLYRIFYGNSDLDEADTYEMDIYG